VKLFFIDLVVVRSPGMQPALKQGEWVFIKRVFTPQRNDVVQIALPLYEKDAQEKSKSFKRIMGMPGDTINIVNSRVYVNGKMSGENELFLHNYIVKIKTQADTVLFSGAGIDEKYLIDDSCAYMLILNDKKFNELQEAKKFASLLSTAEDVGLYDESVFPYNPAIKWNKDFLGPLYIPKKGDVLQLDTSNFRIYKRIICDFENANVKAKGDKLMQDQEVITSYTVKQNYYFVAGDNFDSSIDSRHWGFIPESSIKARLLFKR
jgi:signal peptidase I